MITDEDLAQALDRIARTPDGELLYLYCQKQLLAQLGDHAPKGSALRVEHGMRRFAAQLMALMRKGIEDSDGSSSSDGTGGKRSERVFVFAGAKPVTSTGRLTPREHLRATDPEYARIAAGDGTGR